MKQLLSLFLFLLPCFALAQYPSNGNQKITLGEQTTADGLIYRGLAADTTRKPSIDTMAYIILDTATNIQWHYKKALSNAWVKIGGITVSGTSGQVAYFNGTTSVTGDAGLIYSAANKTLGINTTTTSGANLIIKNSQEPSRSTFLSSQTFGADTTNWTRGTGWTFNGTLAVATAATGNLTYTTLPDTIISGRAYEITYTQSDYLSGTATIALGNVTLAIPQYNVTSNNILLLPTSATGGFRITTSTYTGNLDNISIVEITRTAPVIFAGQDDASATLYNSLRMPNTTTLAFGGGSAITTGANNNFFGANSGQNNTTGANNNFFGANSGQNNTTGNLNNFFGFETGLNNTTGSNNNFFGNSVGKNNTTSSNNNFFGNEAGLNNTTGSSNNFFGNQAGLNNTTSIANNFFGFQAGLNNTTGNFNNFFGFQAGLNNTTGILNLFFSLDAGRNNTTGSYNSFFGHQAGYNNTTGENNSFFGTQAGLRNTSGIGNFFFGDRAGSINRTGSYNISIGTEAMNNTTISDTLSGNQNVVIGYLSATNIASSASGNLVLGNNINIPTNNGSNQVVIKNIIFATGANGTGTTIAGNVGVAVNAPTARLHLAQGTATASTAPLKFTSGVNLTTAEAGAMEFNGTNLLFSPSTTRHTINHGLTGSATLNFLSTNAQNSRDLTIAVTGAADGDVVSLGVPNVSVNANTSYSAWVSAPGTVTVRFNNYSSGAVDPAEGFFKVFVTK